MKVLVNASTICVGGGIQVAVSFITEAERRREQDGIDWFYVISPQIAAQTDLPSAQHEVFDATPSKHTASRKRLQHLEHELRPDAVFTVFGPAYARFQAPHLMGIALGWVTHSTWTAFRALGSPLKMLYQLGSITYRGYHMLAADRWVVEAENARQGLINRWRRPADAIDIVPNTCASVFHDAGGSPATIPTKDETLRLLYLTSWYPHKNIEAIPGYAAALKARLPDRNFEFVVTLKPDSPELGKVMRKAKRLGVADNITNNGPVKLIDAPALYQSSHIAFMPSLLETFSANYPEAMCTGRPIIASDFGFSRVLCKDAARYFDPNDSEQAADAIQELVEDESLWQRQISRGHELLSELPTAQQRYEQYLSCILRLPGLSNAAIV